MTISLIVAASINNAIGKEGKLLWHLPNDMKFFKDTTWGNPVIMGRKTYEALNKVLPGRTNIVITRQPAWKAENAWVATDLTDALEQAATTNSKEIFIIGGGEIYKQSMGVADRIYMTRVQAILDGDAFFPVIDHAKWALKKQVDFATDEKHAYACSFQIWEKYKHL